MPRTFAYARVSTADQTTANQIREIEDAGFKVEHRRVVTDVVSGSSTIEQRKGFTKLLDKLERDDVLIVTKLDRLGRNAMDVASSVTRLAEMGVRVHCLALGVIALPLSRIASPRWLFRRRLGARLASVRLRFEDGRARRGDLLVRLRLLRLA